MATLAPPSITPSPAAPAAPKGTVRRCQPLGERVFNVFVWLLFTLLWAGFAAALLFSQSTLDDLWHYTRDLPLVLQGVVWLLFLPLMAGLWIWETAWPLVVRVVLIAGLAWANVYIFFPRRPAE